MFGGKRSDKRANTSLIACTFLRAAHVSVSLIVFCRFIIVQTFQIIWFFQNHKFINRDTLIVWLIGTVLLLDSFKQLTLIVDALFLNKCCNSSSISLLFPSLHLLHIDEWYAVLVSQKQENCHLYLKIV